MPDIKIKLFAIAKDEAAYIPQWVFHHFYFGFDEIEIWLNNITDNSVTICEKIASQHPNFQFKIVDDVFEHCQKHRIPFQHVAYSRLFSWELKIGKFSHIMFLDLDEFWMPRDFSTKIHEINKNLFDADSLSFPWYIDEAKISNMPFMSLLTIQNIYPNQHVKSMIKVSKDVTLVHAHNAIINNGIGLLETGDVLTLDDTTKNGSIIPKELFTQFKWNISSYFIYHKINRSQIEYMATLLKPNIQDQKTNAMFKENRIGYLNNGSSIRFVISQDALDLYFSLFISFLDDLDLLLDVEQSRLFILKKFIEMKSVLKNNDKMVSNQIFKGLSLLNKKVENHWR